MNPDSTLAVTNTCPKDGVHLYLQLSFDADDPQNLKIDADIDIYTDVLRHLFGEVFKNHLTNVKTDPYRVYQVLTESGIRPAYRLLAADEEIS